MFEPNCTASPSIIDDTAQGPSAGSLARACPVRPRVRVPWAGRPAHPSWVPRIPLTFPRKRLSYRPRKSRAAAFLLCGAGLSGEYNAAMESPTEMPADATLAEDEVRTCLRVLRAIEADRSHLTRL